MSVTVVTIAGALDNEKMSLCVAHARGVSRNMTWGEVRGGVSSRPLPLEVGLSMQLGGLGECCKLPQRGLGDEARLEQTPYPFQPH